MDIALQQKDLTLAESLVSLGSTQIAFEQINAAIDAKKIKAKQQVLNTAIKEEVSNKAKAFGQDEKSYSNVIFEYSTTIKNIEKAYCSASATIASKKIQSETNELNALACIGIYNRRIEKKKQEVEYKNWKNEYNLKLESAYNAKEIGDFETYKKRMEEVKELKKQSPIYADLKSRSIVVEEAKREQDMQKILYRQQSDLAAKRDTIYSNAGIEYKKSMIKAKTPNLFEKMFNLITKKINGKRRFESALQPVKNIIEYIKQSEENFVENTSTMLDLSKDTIRDGKVNFIDLIKTIPEKGTKKVNDIVNDFKTKTSSADKTLDMDVSLEK